MVLYWDRSVCSASVTSHRAKEANNLMEAVARGGGRGREANQPQIMDIRERGRSWYRKNTKLGDESVASVIAF